ncbi:allantoicase-like [Dreissena polymorpha]|uniref:Allantoate amidinohydrolase n=1 Tax=Dreissena polymorpha TaxID=45954 RepID=A0A9D3YIS8_DREPO|nr:allantoicase-like [Dreissena polymorpha]XP_052255226.1 allantoicase-like [Dreissena polymorpha]XP_052255228.1 allantoicase-like [Dreissena polymorpha]KAH3699563.1 hypothetical protein DPMN_074521 [Dreissena polymorpha]
MATQDQTATAHPAIPDFTEYNDLASSKNGGRLLFATDDWFAPAENLLKDEAPIFREGYYTNCGKWMDGWETRRKRCEGYNWCVIQLGISGRIHGIDVDTSFFTGNFAPRCSIQVACLPVSYKGRDPDRLGTAANAEDYYMVEKLKSEDWEYLAPVTALQPGYRTLCHNYLKCSSRKRYTHVRLNIYPDGGIARLRIYGEAMPDWSHISERTMIDLLSAVNGGVCLGYSRTSEGWPRNLILQGLGEGQTDGWKVIPLATRPSVVQFNRHGLLHDSGSEWCVFRLGHHGIVDTVEVDTNHFKGDYPDSCLVEACFIDDRDANLKTALRHTDWKTLLPVTKLKGHNQHCLDKNELESVGVVSHVRLTIYPDGGVSRFRIWGTKAQRPTAKL